MHRPCEHHLDQRLSQSAGRQPCARACAATAKIGEFRFRSMCTVPRVLKQSAMTPQTALSHCGGEPRAYARARRHRACKIRIGFMTCLSTCSTRSRRKLSHALRTLALRRWLKRLLEQAGAWKNAGLWGVFTLPQYTRPAPWVRASSGPKVAMCAGLGCCLACFWA